MLKTPKIILKLSGSAHSIKKLQYSSITDVKLDYYAIGFNLWVCPLIGCDDECLIDEQRLCWGTSSTMCCNVYIDDICMNECPPNQIANEATQFECGKSQFYKNQ